MVVKKLINSTETVLEESLDGFAAAHADILLLGAERKFIRRRALKPGKVALISGGGSGHEPLHAGFVGLGMLDAACPGQVFTSPTPDQMIEAAEAVDTGAGVLFIVKNYEGDVMNFNMAAEMAGRDVATVMTNDDVAVEKSTYTTGRRGVAGTMIVEKMVGAAAETGTPLAALKALGEEVNGRTRSMGVALPPAPCRRRAGRTSPWPTTKWKWASAFMASRAVAGCRWRRPTRSPPNARRDPWRSGAGAGQRGAAAGQWVRRHAAARTLSDGQQRQADSGRRGDRGDAFPDRLLCHVAGYGRCLDHPIGARRSGETAVGCAGAHRGAALGSLTSAACPSASVQLAVSSPADLG